MANHATTARRQATPSQPQATPSPTVGSAGSSAILGSNGSPPLLLDRRGLSHQLCVSEKTVARMIAAGRLPQPVLIGKRRRWPRATITRWIELGAPSAADFAKMTKP